MGTVLAALYPWTKTLHIVSMVAWMAGLFYLPRLFVYHAERAATPGELSETFKVMEAKLMRVIMRPAMLATWSFGILLAVTPGVVHWGADYWFHIKLAAVLALSAFHEWLERRRQDFADDANRISGQRYRAMNEIPTALLLVIVTMVVVRPF